MYINTAHIKIRTRGLIAALVAEYIELIRTKLILDVLVTFVAVVLCCYILRLFKLKS